MIGEWFTGWFMVCEIVVDDGELLASTNGQTMVHDGEKYDSMVD